MTNVTGGLFIDNLVVNTIEVLEGANPPAGGSELWNDTAGMSGPNNGLNPSWDTVIGSPTYTFPNSTLHLVGEVGLGAFTTNVGGIAQEPPIAPYSMTCLITLGDLTEGQHAGLAFVSPTGEIWSVGSVVSTGVLQVRAIKRDSSTGSYSSTGDPLSAQSVYIRASDDGSNIKLEASADNVTYTTLIDTPYATGFDSGLAPSAIALIVDSWQAAIVPSATFGPLIINAENDTRPALGNFTSNSTEPTPGNFVIYQDKTGKNGIDSGVPSAGAAAGQHYKSASSAPFLMGLSNFANDVLDTLLSGLSLATSQVIANTDTILQAFGYLQAQITEAMENIFTRMRYTGAWSSGTAYEINDVVSSSGVRYICILNHTNHAPPNATYWEAISTSSLTGTDIFIDASGFSNNLDGSVTNAQLLADAVDALTTGGGGGGSQAADLFNHHGDAGNVSTGETDLYSDTLAASQLAATDDKIQARYSGLFVGSATATRQLRVKFAGNTIFDSGALSIAADAKWDLSVFIIRVSGSVIRYAVTLITNGASVETYLSQDELTGLTLSATNILKITGQAGSTGAATDDIVAKMGNVYYIPVGAVGTAGGGGRILVSEQFPTGTGTVLFTPTGLHNKIIIEGVIKSTQAADYASGLLEFNGDTTAANYTYQQDRTNQAGASNDNGTDRIWAYRGVDASNGNSNEFTFFSIVILNYASTGFYKRAMCNIANIYNAPYYQAIQSVLYWRDASAITSLVLSLSAGNYAANSVLRMYEED